MSLGKVLAGISLFSLPTGFSSVVAQTAEELLREETVSERPSRIDPNQAPLFLLSRVPGIGRRGADRIGRRRGESALRSVEELLALATDLVPSALRQFRFPSKRPLSLILRHRLRWEGGQRGESETIEAGWGAVSSRFFFERDRGERDWNDFSSWSLEWSPAGRRVRVLLGDLAVRLGSGLLVGTSSPFGPPSRASPFRQGRLSRYRSRAESNAHRGLALRTLGSIGSLSLLLTSTGRDARIDKEGRVSSLDPQGLHRSRSERGRKDALRERIVATRWEGGGGRVRAGVTVAYARFDPSLGGGDALRKPKVFRGDRLAAASLDLRLARGGVCAAGEIASSSSGGAAGRAFLRYQVRSGAVAIRFRNFSGRFHAPRGTVYHRLRGEPSGEVGWMVLAERRAGPGGSLSARFHQYASFDRTYRSEEPVMGTEWSGRLERPAGAARLYLRAGGERRREVRQAERRVGDRFSLGGGLSAPLGRTARLRFDGKQVLGRDPGEDEMRGGSGVSVVLETRSLSLAWTTLWRNDAVLLFPSPALPGSLPLAWYGRGRGDGGIRFRWRGSLPRGVRFTTLLAPGELGLELSIGRLDRG